MKKLGYYFFEEKYIVRLCKELQLVFYSCFLLMWIMEVVDDIFYCVVDFEDVVEKRIFSVEQFYYYLYYVWGYYEKDLLFELVVGNVWEKLCVNILSCSIEDQFFMYLWVNILNKLVFYVVQCFIDNLLQIFVGIFNQVLLEDVSGFSCLFEFYKNVVVEYVFSYLDVEQFELQGYWVISGLLDIYQLLLSLLFNDFCELVEKEWLKCFFIELCLFQKFFMCYCLVYVEVVSKLFMDLVEYLVLEYYYCCWLIQDYISGMIDFYVWDEYWCLMVVEQ